MRSIQREERKQESGDNNKVGEREIQRRAEKYPFRVLGPESI